MGKNKEQNLSWDVFQSLGNPENAPEIPEENEENEYDYGKMEVRLIVDRKARKGKVATLINIPEMEEEDMEPLAKEIKKHCGGGGSIKDGEILIQGNHRDKIKAFLEKKGFKKIKYVGG